VLALIAVVVSVDILFFRHLVPTGSSGPTGAA
jgi:hypothetical protein